MDKLIAVGGFIWVVAACGGLAVVAIAEQMFNSQFMISVGTTMMAAALGVAIVFMISAAGYVAFRIVFLGD